MKKLIYSMLCLLTLSLSLSSCDDEPLSYPWQGEWKVTSTKTITVNEKGEPVLIDKPQTFNITIKEGVYNNNARFLITGWPSVPSQKGTPSIMVAKEIEGQLNILSGVETGEEDHFDNYLENERFDRIWAAIGLKNGVLKFHINPQYVTTPAIKFIKNGKTAISQNALPEPWKALAIALVTQSWWDDSYRVLEPEAPEWPAGDFKMEIIDNLEHR